MEEIFKYVKAFDGNSPVKKPFHIINSKTNDFKTTLNN